ncbi:copper-binding protein [Paracidovorax konjaci]|nr:copper-binding protein [Paracidovorax konjaci]
MKKLNTLLVLVAALAASVQAFAATPTGAPMVMAEGAAAGDMVDGEVRKVDMEAKKITIKHGDIKNLDMPGMTMVFQVKDPAMLDKVKAGDKVKFKAEKAGGAIVVTEIAPTK